MTIIDYMGDTVKVAGECPFCGAVRSIVVKAKNLKAYQDGELVQDAFPMLNASDRELLMTGICDECW
jgi:hypothetical protein